MQLLRICARGSLAVLMSYTLAGCASTSDWGNYGSETHVREVGQGDIQPAQIVIHDFTKGGRPPAAAPVRKPQPVVRAPRPMPEPVVPAVAPVPVPVEDEQMLPPNARPGECYARVYLPPEYETVEERMLLQEASERVEIVPAEYEWVEEEVLVQEASEELEVVPAEYDWVEEEVLVTPPSTRIEEVPAEYEWVDEKVLVKPAHTVWKKGRGPIESVDNATGEIMCLVEVPAEYKTVRKQVLATPASTRVVEVPAEYKTIRKKVMVKAPTTRTVTIPAEYKTIQVKKMVSPPERKVTPIEAEYQTVTKEVLVREGRMGWKRVLCETNMSRDLLTRVQEALVQQGYTVGETDGIIGPETQEAIKAYQRANSLAVGGLTYETLESLGVTI